MAASFNAPYMVVATGLTSLVALVALQALTGLPRATQNRLLVYQEPVFSRLSASSKSLAISCSSF